MGPRFYFSAQLDILYIHYDRLLNNHSTRLITKLLAIICEPEKKLGLKYNSVENLAIFVDGKAIDEFPKYSDNVEQWRVDDGDPEELPEELSYEKLITEVLQTLGSVQHLTIVVKDYISDDIRPFSSPTLIEPLDVEEACCLLVDDFCYWPVLSWNGKDGQCLEPGLVKSYCETVKINPVLLDKCRAELLEPHPGKPFNIPKIEYRVSVPSCDFTHWLETLKLHMDNGALEDSRSD